MTMGRATDIFGESGIDVSENSTLWQRDDSFSGRIEKLNLGKVQSLINKFSKICFQISHGYLKCYLYAYIIHIVCIILFQTSLP